MSKIKKGSIEAMQVKEFTEDFINWALIHQIDSFEFIVEHYSRKSMRLVLDTMLKQLINQFMQQKH